PDEDGVAHRTRGPVVMAAAPTWLRSEPAPAPMWPAATGGAVFLALLAAMWYILIRSHRRDRRLPRA
ncbi:MAG: hypothetical protein KDA44_19085, partial [Planctomycetales bacterium]|nr:hypothetical protein [Planctomycetales bacterium]